MLNETFSVIFKHCAFRKARKVLNNVHTFSKIHGCFWGMTFGFQVLWSLLESQSEWLRCFPLLDFHVDKKVGKILGDETRVTLSFFFLLQKIFYWMRVVQSEACEEFFSLITPRQWKPWTMGVARKHLLFVSVSSFMLKGLFCLSVWPPSHSVLKSVKNVSFLNLNERSELFF